jgi:hypothetical protein
LSGYTNKNSPAVAISAGLWYFIGKESAVRQTVSIFLANQLKNDRRVGSSWGGHFLCVKILLKQTFPRFSTMEASVFFYPMDRIEKRGYT